MLHILSPQGENHLTSTLEAHPLLAFDFDGTLAPIVAKPEQARMAPGVTRRLQMLALHLPVAIVTGREIADVRARLGFEPRYIVGSHGAESDFASDAAQWLPAMQCARDWLAERHDEFKGLGVQIEDKRNSIALHYRLSPDRERAGHRLEEILRSVDPALHVFGGKFVYNMVPAMAPNKADAVHALVQHSQTAAAVFIGDDVNDEPVFASAPAHWLTIKVGRNDPRSKAQFYLDSPNEIAMLLDRARAILNV